MGPGCPEELTTHMAAQGPWTRMERRREKDSLERNGGSQGEEHESYWRGCDNLAMAFK